MSAERIARPRVLRGIRLDQSSVLEASAGTGKTHALESIVTELVLSTSVELDRVLLVTFTERATSELRERVRTSLETLHAGRAEPASESDIRHGDFWTLDTAAKARVARALNTFDGATIATIHAFCQRVLREVAFTGGRLFTEEQVDGREAFGRAMKDALRTVAKDEVCGPWLETALADGWTVPRIEELLWQCAVVRGDLRPALDVEALSTSLAAWPAALARSADLAHDIRAWGTHPSTAKAVARRIAALAEVVEGARSGSGVSQYVLDAAELKLDDLLEKVTGLRPKPGPTALVCAAAARLASVTPPFTAGLVQVLLPVVTQSLNRTKRATGGYDFDDMLLLVDEALRGPRGGALAESMRRRWRYAFIDEFQDTDETQWSIFRRAFFEGGDPTTRSFVFLVGDPKQSIYRFRGADVATYLSARSAVIDQDGQRLSLEDSYRATQALVDATNEIFDQKASEPVFSGRVSYTPVRCGRPERQLVDGDGRPLSAVHLLQFERELSLAGFARIIEREIGCMTDPARPWRLDGRALEPQDAFVLTRSAREGRVLGEALRELGVPHAFYKEDGLFQSEQAEDLAILLAAIADPSDRARRFSAWLTPFFGLPLSAIDRARDLPPSQPLVARLLAWKALADGRDFGRLFESILRDSGIVRREIFFGRGERALTNLQHLIELLTERAQGGHKTVDDLVSELVGLRTRTRATLDIEGNVQRLEGDRPAVQIMTIHKAKGLEAPVVFVAGGASAPPPDDVRLFRSEGRRLAWIGRPSGDAESLVKQSEKEEDERLMYVALTRAMGRLYLPCIADGDKPKSLRGALARINGRLFDLGRASHGSWTSEEVVSAPAKAAVTSSEPWSWHPPPSLLAPEAAERRYDALRVSRAGAVATSYTRMKAERQKTGADTAAASRVYHAATHQAEALPTMLRGARGSGVFLHELLERVPLASFVSSVDIDTWRRRSEVVELVSEAMAVHRVATAQRDHAERLVWTAYTTPIDLPGGGRLDRLAATPHMVREMRYAFPVQPLQEPGGHEHASPVRRPDAYVRGSLDLVFEHRGLAYFVDWKSDSLASYTTEALGPHVSENYREQVALYALALVKLIGVKTESEYLARFGGMIYCFLRGLDGVRCGLWSARPSWAEVTSWGEDLRASRPLGGGDRLR
jgi:exodeoxyribonuclease V beta subunit